MVIKIICLFIFALCLAAMETILHEDYDPDYEEDGMNVQQ